MSQYNQYGQPSSSQIPAYPYHHQSQSQRWYHSSADSEPYNSNRGIRPAEWYGPIPAIPPSLQPGQQIQHGLPSNSNETYQSQAGPSRPTGAGMVGNGNGNGTVTGRDYLKSLGEGMDRLSLNTNTRKAEPRDMGQVVGYEKPLPQLPVQLELPFKYDYYDTRPTHATHPAPVQLELPFPTHPSPSEYQQSTSQSISTSMYNTSIRPSLPPQSHSDIPPKSFKASPYLIIPSPPRRRPNSDPCLPKPVDPSNPSTPKQKAQKVIVDLTYLPSSPSASSSSSSSLSDDLLTSGNVTPRSLARLRKRAISHEPSSTSTASPSRATKSNSIESPIGKAVRCSGYTRTGKPCKRLVKTSAPYLIDVDVDLNGAEGVKEGSDEDEGVGRYCKDHAGLICSAKGFYSREKRGLWIEFDDWIPPELGQQTQTLLRMAMESKLTPKESSGYIYAYELRDLQTGTTSFYKVGRTDNVPRRMGQWTNQCQSKTPTLRDIFPLSSSRLTHLLSSSTSNKSSPLNRHGTLTKSLLPGALSSGTLSSSQGTESPAVKRWERLIHLELAEISSGSRMKEWKECRRKCGDCGALHKEIFPIPREYKEGIEIGEGGYQVVVEVIERWERFVRMMYG